MDTEVLIVGGGPVGLGLAIELGQRGIETIVLEGRDDISRVPKGQNLTQRTMEHFHFWGAEDALREARAIPASYGIGGLTAYGTLLSGYHYDWLQRGVVRPFYFTDNERLPQYATEAVLRARVAELASVTARYGWTGDAFEQDKDGVTVEAAERSGGGPVRIRAPYLVDCDGARSRIRDFAGIGQQLSDHDKLMALLVFRSEGLSRLLSRFPGKSYFNVLHPDLGGYWQFFGRVDLDHNWFFHAPVPPGARDLGHDFAALLQRAVGADFDVAFEHVGFWDLRFAIAESYRAGRVFIGGDAAHSHPPYGGYGINTGFEDARNLGWKLAAALRGWGGDALLDSYDEERRPVFESTSSEFIESAIEEDRAFLARFDPAGNRAAFEAAWADRATGANREVQAFEPHYDGSPVVLGMAGERCGAKGRHGHEARAGHHLSPAALTDGRNIFEALGPGFTLVALDAPDEEVDAFTVAAESLFLPLHVVRDTAQGEPRRYGASLFLVRPDHYVAWTADRAPFDPWHILARVTGRA